MKERKEKASGKLLVLTLFSLIFIICFSGIIVNADSSTSIYSAQYFPPSVTGQFSSLMSGPVATGGALGQQDNGFFDMQLFIPPFGCQPYVVRSDLLEEQDVPVFCQLMPLKINPGVDITRIDSLSIVQKTPNQYISGVGFHPANAAIASLSNLASTPNAGNIGYVVVVLKRQEVEKNMPNNVTVTLGAQLQYGATNTFGIEKNELYLPVMTQEEFDSNFQDYSFYNGAGYIRAEAIDANSARISVYGFNNQIIFSNTIQKGATSADFYLPNNYGGQGIRITLEDITLPQTKAKFNVNGQKLDVYVGQQFYDGKCRLTNVQSTGLGSGTATAVCNGVTFPNLQKKIVPVQLQTISAGQQPYNLGDSIPTLDVNSDYYLVFANRANTAANSYVVIANISSDIKSKFNENKIKNLNTISVSLTNSLSGKSSSDVPKNINANSIDVPLITIKQNGKDDASGIGFGGTTTNNGAIDGTVKSVYQDAISFYDKVKGDFSGETYPLDPHNPQHSYAEEALWDEYNLAVKLGQQSDANQVLSRIFNEYPGSLNGADQSASMLINSPTLLADNPEAKQYDAKNDLSIELLSVTEPSAADHSVSLGASMGAGVETKSQLVVGDTVYSDPKQTVTLKSFDDTSVNLDCSTTGKTAIVSSLTAKIGTPAVFNSGDCKVKIFVNSINFKRVAKVLITPITNGRSRESNFTFSIGIEKRALGMNLTPEEANAKIAKLDEQIANFQKISAGLANLTQAGKAVCLATSAIINVKNLFNGLGGEASARSEVMQKWNDICSSTSYLQDPNHKYDNSEKCIAGEYDSKIAPEIKATTTAMKDYNDAEKRATDAANLNKNLNPEQRQAKIKADILTNLQGKLNVAVSGDCKTDKTTGAQTGCTSLNAADILSMVNADKIPTQSLPTLYVNLQMINSATSETSKKAYRDAAYETLKSINNNVQIGKVTDQLASQLQISTSELDGAIVGKETQELSYTGKTWMDYSNKISISPVPSPNTPIVVDTYASKYLVLYLLDDSLLTQSIYRLGSSATPKLLYSANAQTNGAALNSLTDEEKVDVNVLRNVHFKKVDSPTNICSNCNLMKVFSLDPFKGQPALLPFDYDNGFYVQVKNDFPVSGLGTGNVASYQDSGKVNTFYLCNVGKNKLMEGYQIGDDTCRRFDFYTGDMLDSYPGLTKDQTKKKVLDALTYLKDAQKQLQANPSATTIKINGRTLTVKSSEGSTGSKCTDFMSPGDCQVIYNVCDPFVCPNSRCDFGGRYPVDNVISSGIIGSTLLCLPNFIGLSGNENTGVAVPVCITGINAGLNAWIGILKSYRSCINESVTTGRTVGICDEINSIYLCDMFWRQAGPLASALTKNIFTSLFSGSGDHGGGEYAFTNDAWNNAAKSVANFENSYSKDSNLRFGFQSIASTVVADVCKLPVSATYPDNFKTMLEPELPVQFSAWFEELPYTSATVPPTSQYNVFYEIYGGDQGHYYQIYLKSPPTAIGYIGKDSTIVASGYVDKGQTASETKNFIDTSGFKQLCVRIDAQDKCGFKSVSTSAALNYAKQKVVESQATSQVTTESECIAGGNSIGSFLTPNVQQGAEEFINPELYNQGIIRVCSNKNPGQSTEPSRWSDVGYCDDRTVRCWLDGKSVAKAIQNKGILNQTLAEISNISQQNLAADGYYANDVPVTTLKNVYMTIVDLIKTTNTKATDVNSVSYPTQGTLDYNNIDYNGRTLASLKTDVKQLDKKLIFSKDRAELWFAEAQIYDTLAQNLNQKSSPVVDNSAAAGTKAPSAAAVTAVEYQIFDTDIQVLASDGVSLVNTGLTIVSGQVIKYNTLSVASISNKVITIDKTKLASLIPKVRAYLTDLDGAKINSNGVEIILAKEPSATAPEATL